MTTTGKRTYRELDNNVRAKISQSLKNRSKSSEHIRKISDGLKKYWQTIPEKPKEHDEKENSGVVI